MLFVLDCYCTPPPSFHLEFLKDTTLNGVEHSNGVEQIKHEGTFDAIVTKNERITTADHFQDVRHIELKIQTDNHSNLYEPGDVAVIRPKNLPNEVDAFLEYMGWLDLSEELLIVHPNSEGNSSLLTIVTVVPCNYKRL
jgi:sulfite reductase alpha subunit-like flavoprotein